MGNTKVMERSLNVYENKGALWKTRGRSWNVCENKGSYAFNPGMYLKKSKLTNNRNPKYRLRRTLGLILRNPTPPVIHDKMSLRPRPSNSDRLPLRAENANEASRASWRLREGVAGI
jgi:hypothetical protein